MSTPADTIRVTQLLQKLGDGDAAAADELLPLVYRELHQRARQLMHAERGDHTLQTTALIHEAWMRLVGSDEAEFESRAHFLKVAARAMRNVLVDHARAKRTRKRGDGGEKVPLDDAIAMFERDDTDLIALDDALQGLSAKDELAARIVELRFFGGLTLEEAGRVLGLTVRQVHWNWTFARGWLRRELDRGAADV